MCSGRVDPSFVISSFRDLADGIIIVGCRVGECHYATDGNIHAYAMSIILRKVLAYIGIEPRRLRMEFLSSAEGVKFAEVMKNFVNEIKELGPIGKKEKLAEDAISDRLGVLLQLIPYIKLVEREKFRVSGNDLEKIEKFFESEEVQRVFSELVLEKVLFGIVLEARKKGIDGIAELERTIDKKTLLRILNELETYGFIKKRFEGSKYGVA